MKLIIKLNKQQRQRATLLMHSLFEKNGDAGEWGNLVDIEQFNGWTNTSQKLTLEAATLIYEGHRGPLINGLSSWSLDHVFGLDWRKNAYKIPIVMYKTSQPDWDWWETKHDVSTEYLDARISSLRDDLAARVKRLKHVEEHGESRYYCSAMTYKAQIKRLKTDLTELIIAREELENYITNIRPKRRAAQRKELEKLGIKPPAPNGKIRNPYYLESYTTGHKKNIAIFIAIKKAVESNKKKRKS